MYLFWYFPIPGVFYVFAESFIPFEIIFSHLLALILCFPIPFISLIIASIMFFLLIHGDNFLLLSFNQHLKQFFLHMLLFFAASRIFALNSVYSLMYVIDSVSLLFNSLFVSLHFFQSIFLSHCPVSTFDGSEWNIYFHGSMITLTAIFYYLKVYDSFRALPNISNICFSLVPGCSHIVSWVWLKKVFAIFIWFISSIAPSSVPFSFFLLKPHGPDTPMFSLFSLTQHQHLNPSPLLL